MSSNNFVLPQVVSTIAQSRLDYNQAITSVLQNFASSGQPAASSINLIDVTGPQTGMLWYKAGSNTADGQGQLYVYDGSSYTRNGLATYTMPSTDAAVRAAANGKISYGQLIVVPGDTGSRLYMVNSSGNGVVDVGIPPVGYTVSNANLLDGIDSSSFLRSDAADTFTQDITGTAMLRLTNTTATSNTVASLWLSGASGALMADSQGNKRLSWNDGGSCFSLKSGVYYNAGDKYVRSGDGAGQLCIFSDGTHGNVRIRVADTGVAGATPVWAQTYEFSNTGLKINSNTVWHSGNDGSGSGLDADLLDGVNLATIQTDYRSNSYNTYTLLTANDYNTLLSARANDYNMYTTLSVVDTNNLNTARANDYATYTTLTNADSSNLLTARANDYATWSGIISYANLKSNTASPTFTGTVTAPTFIASASGGFRGTDADTASQPSFTWPSDQNTGVYRPAADQVGLATGGLTRLIASNAGVSIYSGNLYIPDVLYHDGDTSTFVRFPSANTIQLATSGTSRLQILPAGDIGIGTTTPSTKLHVYGTGQTTANLTDAGASDDIIKVSGAGSVGGTGGAIAFSSQQGDAAGSLGFAAIKGLLQNGSNNTIGDLTISTRNLPTDTSLTERIRITYDGNVGIGTTAASAKLEVAGSTELNGNVTTYGRNTIYGDTVGSYNTMFSSNLYYEGAWKFLGASGYGGGIKFADSSSSINLFGTTVASNASGSTATLRTLAQYELATDNWKFFTGTTERLRIDPVGNVGIGTGSPRAPLHVFPSGDTTTNYTALISQFQPSLVFEDRTGSAVDYQIYLNGNRLGFRSGDASTGTLLTTEALALSGTSVLLPATGTETRGLEIGIGRVSDGVAHIDLIGDTTYTDYGARFIRNSGTNGETQIVHRGAGYLDLVAQDTGIARIVNAGVETLRATASARIGINEQDPASRLHVSDNAVTNSGNAVPLISLELFDADNTENVAVGTGPAIDFYVPDSTGPRLDRSQLSGRIACIRTGSSDASGHASLVFSTALNGLSLVEQLTIQASGSATFAQEVTAPNFNTTSDITVKENIEIIPNAIDKVLALTGYTFNYITKPDKKQAGVIAQEVEKVLPEVVTEAVDGTKTVAYGNMVALLIEAIKHQQKEIDELKKLIQA